MIADNQNISIIDFLEEKVAIYNQPDFISNDPISIPHSYTLKQDIEITGFWAAIFSWGQRITIIRKSKELFELMDNAPYDFILNHTENDRKRFEQFKHRTFNYTDTLYFLEFLQHHYKRSDSLEDAFFVEGQEKSMRENLIAFNQYFFSLPYAPQRTQKHIATPARKSTCKRINMFLRWMVRKDDNGVDFGIWSKIKPSQLMMPFDVHVAKSSRVLGLLDRKQNDWQAVEELTQNLRQLDTNDPVKYDYALFGMSAFQV